MPASATLPTVIFLHIPKTAGTTMRSILQRQYQAEGYYDYDRGRGGLAPFESFERCSPQEKASVRLLAGHIAYGIHEQFSQACTYLTAVRDPVARVVSHYYYLLDEPKTPHYETVKALSLEQFADRLGMGSNLQTKLLAGVADLEASPDPDLLVRAKANLRRHFVAPIIVERFDESLMIVRDALGWGSVHYSKLLKNRNRTGMAPLPGRTRRLIERRNAMDLEIYTFANNLLDAAVAERNGAFAAELRHFRRVNRVYALPSQLKLAAKHRLKVLLSGGGAVSPR